MNSLAWPLPVSAVDAVLGLLLLGSLALAVWLALAVRRLEAIAPAAESRRATSDEVERLARALVARMAAPDRAAVDETDGG